MNEEYLELYSDLDSADAEVGGGTAIMWVLISKVRIANSRVIYVN